MTPSVKVLMGCLLATACGSQPSSRPHSEVVAAHDTRPGLLGVWTAEFVPDTVDSFVVEREAARRVAHRSVTTRPTIGTIVLLDSLTPDGARPYARLDGDLLGLLCFEDWKTNIVEVPLRRTGDTVAFRVPPGHMYGPWYVNPNLFAFARYHGDSVVGTWSQVCSGAAGGYATVRAMGRWRSA